VLRLTVGVGIGVLCAHTLRPTARREQAPADPLTWGLIAIVSVLALLTCVGAMTDRGQWWAFDDSPAYLVFSKQLHQAGDMIQPFSFRRMTSLGAQSLFQAAVLVGATPEGIHLFDRGVCGIVLVALLLGAPRGRAAPPMALRLLPALLVLLMPNYRLNSAATLSGTVVLFAIYRTLDLPPSPTRKRRMHAAALGLLVALACALRPFFVLPAVAAVALAYALERPEASDRSGVPEEALVAAGVTVLAVLPWSIGLLRSNGTPMYPPFAGDYQAESGFMSVSFDYTRAKLIWDELRFWEPIETIHLFFIAALILYRRESLAFRVSCAGLVLGLTAMLVFLPGSDYRELARYLYPLELALALIVAMRALATFATPGEPGAMAAGFLVLAACSGELYWKRDEAERAYDDGFEQGFNILRGRELLPGGGRPTLFRRTEEDVMETPILSLRAEQTYTDLQRAVPAGAPILAMVEEPYRFDFRRNRVTILDLPGVAGPRGGIPVFQGAEAVAAYFHSLGFRYLTLTDTRSTLALYSLRSWETHASIKTPQTTIAPRVLDVFGNLSQLTQSRRRVFEADGIVVIDLDQPS
jgi:hypothetical protein